MHRLGSSEAPAASVARHEVDRRLRELARRASTGDAAGALLELIEWRRRGDLPPRGRALLGALRRMEGDRIATARRLGASSLSARLTARDRGAVHTLAQQLEQEPELIETISRAIILRQDRNQAALMRAALRAATPRLDALGVFAAFATRLSLARLSRLLGRTRAAWRYAHAAHTIDPGHPEPVLFAAELPRDRVDHALLASMIETIARAHPDYRDVQQLATDWRGAAADEARTSASDPPSWKANAA